MSFLGIRGISKISRPRFYKLIVHNLHGPILIISCMYVFAYIRRFGFLNSKAHQIFVRIHFLVVLAIDMPLLGVI